MALEVRRIVTGHDANGKAIVASDERMSGVSAPNRPYISRCEIWSTDKMPVDNSAVAAAAASELSTGILSVDQSSTREI